MIKYYVGMPRISDNGVSLSPCDGPFETPEDAKEFMEPWITTPCPSPEILLIPIIVANDETMLLDIYKEDGMVINVDYLRNQRTKGV